ncbi:MAG TPA: adenylate/guanylate cyclase domain-containing protein [Puia sp.]|nr:adenylate/guanylate cyclase domain-containing protein [Puia sp.]
MEEQNRHLAAILFTDVVGYTAMMQLNEQKAVTAIKKHNAVLEKIAAAHHGQMINYYGDGSLSIFQSATEAIQSAMEAQQEMQKDPAVPLRIGLHIGEIFFEDGKALGDGVNVASRIQSLGQANTILFSDEIHNKIKNNQEFKSVSLGLFDFKNVDKPVEVYALANEGLFVPKRENMEGKLKHLNRPPYRKRIFAAVVLFLLICTGFFYKHYSVKKKFTGLDKSVVVIPFVNMSGNKTNEYLGDGIAEDITTQLSKIPALKVISGFAMSRYKNSTKTFKQIAEETGVASLLVGNIQMIGEEVRITARLIDAGTQELIWSNKFDNKNKNDILTIQSNVALQIAEELDANLSKDEKNNIQKTSTNNPAAYDLCLKGRAFWNQRNEAALRKGLIFFDSSIKLDPLYSNAFSGKADCLTALGYGSYDAPVNTFLKAQEAATRALELDPSLAEPHTSLGYINFYYSWNWAGAEHEFQKAISLNPKYEIAYDWYGVYLTAMEKFDEAGKTIEIARSINPLSPFIITDMGFSMYYGTKYDEAIRSLKSTIELFPAFPLAHLWLGRAYQAKKMYTEALNEYQLALAVSKDFVPTIAAMGYVYGITGKKGEAEKILSRLNEMSTHKYVTPYGFALVYASLGNKDKAFEYLEKAYVDRSHWLVWLKLDTRWESIRSDKRFTDLLNKVGLPN